MRRVYRVEYTVTARADLFAIGDRVRVSAGPQIAERFIERIIVTAESLSDMPARHRLRPALGKGIRAISLRKYLLFYRVEGDMVSIVRVLHGARKITAKLLKE